MFGTPLDADIQASVTALGFPCVVASTVAEIDEALKSALESGGVHVIVARTCARDHEAEILMQVKTAIDQALATA